MLLKKLHGVHAPHFKNTAGNEPERMPVPKVLEIPMVMHIGAKAQPIVKPGELVKVGQQIAEAGGFVSSPIYSGVSGKVKKIDEILISNGQIVPSIIIESDGLQEMAEGIEPPEVHDFDSFTEAVRRSGVVGLGGAGFPTVVKVKVDADRVDTIIVNGAECEPYITSDTRTMLDKSDLVIEGIKLLQKYLEVDRAIIGIENNKPQCIAKFNSMLKEEPSISVAELPALYPQGGEKVLIHNTVGRIVPEGKLPLDVGVIVINCTTLAYIAEYIKTGMPLVEKCITVDGSAVANPKNVIAPIGTHLREVFEFCGGFKEEPKKILYGGPMMGIAVPNLESPVLKNTNAILAFNEKDAVPPEPTACLRCGRCIGHCPMRLMPMEIISAYETQNADKLRELKVNLCMECGCCSYVCPAKRPLIQTNKVAKGYLNKLRAEAEAQKAKEAERAAKLAEKEKEDKNE